MKATGALAAAPAVAALALDAPAAVITLDEGEVLSHGIDANDIPTGSFVLRPPRNGNAMVIPDIGAVDDLADDELVGAHPRVRVAAGVTLRDHDGRTIGALWAFGDDLRCTPETTTVLHTVADHIAALVATVAARDQAEDERRVATDRSETLTRVFGERTTFLAIAQHKLKTPLAVLSGWASALEEVDELTPEERRSGVQAIANATTELRHQIDDLLDEARSQLIGSALQLERIPLREFVDGLLDESRIDDALHPTTVAIGPDVSVYADRMGLREVLAHLLDNAQKYSPDGGAITIEATDGDVVDLRVGDHGIGLGDEVDIFAPFERADNATAVARGTGLGLHIVRSLVERMGGSISAGPGADGTGSTFRVLLPPEPETTSPEGDVSPR